MQEDLDAAVAQHEQIIAAIEQHNATVAGEIVRIHLDLSRRRMTEYVRSSADVLDKDLNQNFKEIILLTG